MLIVVFIVMAVLVMVSVRKFGTITNPFVMELQSVALMIVVPQLLWLIVDPEAEMYIYSDLAILTYIVFLYLGSSLNLKGLRLKEIRHVTAVNTANWLLFILFLSPLIPQFLTFDFSFMGIRQFYEFIVFSKYASFFELSKFVLYLIIFYRLIRDKKFTTGTVVLIPILFLFGSKMALLDFFLALLVFLEHFRRISYRKLIVLSAVCALLLVVYRFTQSKYGDNIWITALSYFDQYKNQSFLIEKLITGEVDYYYGEVYWSSYLKYIPRIIWEDKPRAFGFAVINYDFMSKSAEAGYMPAFGLGPTFADFGFFSVAFTGLLSGIIRRYLYSMFLKSNNNISFLFYALPLSILSFAFLMIDLFVEHFARNQRQETDGADPESASAT